MESIKFGNLLINFTTEFNWIWDNKGSPNASPVGFWRPVPSADFLTDYFPLGDYAVAGHHNINKKIVMAVVCEAPPQTEDDRINGKALMPPDEFERVWDDKGSKAYSDGSIWRPIPPSGYVAMGLVASRGQPPADKTVAALKHSPTPLASRLAPNGVSTYGGASGKVSAKLSGGFTHTQTSSEGWTTSTAFEINATVPAHKAVAVYLVQSDYKLLRENGTQVATDISYTDGDNVYWSEYPPARECEVTCKPLPAPGS